MHEFEYELEVKVDLIQKCSKLSSLDEDVISKTGTKIRLVFDSLDEFEGKFSKLTEVSSELFIKSLKAILKASELKENK